MSNGGFNYAENAALIIQRRIALNSKSIYQQNPVHDADQNDIITGFLQKVCIFFCELLSQHTYPTYPWLQMEVKTALDDSFLFFNGEPFDPTKFAKLRLFQCYK